ncbi:transporter substrate-binding domain-containing protein [Desulfospira joergensenii]|uniref:transporter substrate-binding domain-containing protein n=1 Tax=Desulfospira joergensenii TaxID=53329 RepID=UPI0003B6BB20|nr:transporter substrate-binding domain-containing protein [Desulfospira joergensenii]
MGRKIGLKFVPMVVMVSIMFSISAMAADGKWAQIQKTGKLVVGNCPEYPPFSFRDTNNKIEGFDTDFAKALGDALGLEMVMKDTAWEGLVAGMKKGDHDIIISCISPETATRASKNVNMSIPYHQVSEIIITRASVEDINSKEDLSGKIVGVQTNCTSEAAVDNLKNKGIVTKDIRRYERNAEALIDLKNGRVDAVVVGFAYAATTVKGNSDLKIINDPVKSVDVVVVMDHGEDELTRKINDAIKMVKSNGAFDKAYQKWLSL